MRSESPASDTSSSGPGTPPEPSAMMGDKDAELASWNEPHTFHTLSRQRRFMHPKHDARDVPELREITRPHVESFNALWAEDPSIDAAPGVGLEGMGLLERSLQTLPPRVVFDGHGGEGDKGNRLESTLCGWILTTQCALMPCR